jgi:twinkle protein
VRVWFVDWPEGCKDANDMLLSDGPEALYDLVTHGALEWPVRGLYRLSQLPEVAAISTWDPGFPEWENRVKVAPGMMSVAPAFQATASRYFSLSFGFRSSGATT